MSPSEDFVAFRAAWAEAPEHWYHHSEDTLQAFMREAIRRGVELREALMALLVRMQQMQSGEDATESRDFGRGVSWAVAELTRTLDDHLHEGMD